MDIGELISDSITYTQEALVGKWMRWAIFILLALPFSLVQFLFDPKKYMVGTTVDWSAIPWGQIIALAGIGFILSFFISGYMVRIYRGVKPAPDFTEWISLFIDGVKLAIVWLLWILPLVIVMAAGVAVAFVGIASVTTTSAGTATTTPNFTLLLLLLLLLLVGLVLLILVLLFGIIGAVRFARMGSIREGIRFSGILTTIRNMGWMSYILALIGFVIAAAIYAIITSALAFIPYIGWVLVLIITPLFTIFSARYFSLVYDQGESKPVPVSPEPMPAI